MTVTTSGGVTDNNKATKTPFTCLHLLLSLVLLTATCEAQRLVINPRGTQIKTVHSGAIFTCSITDYEPPPDWTAGPSIRWLGPGLVPVTATRGRVYVERSGTLSLRLYITRIDESDAGLYTCTADIARTASRDSQQRPLAASPETGEAEQPSSRQRRMLTLSQRTKLFLYDDIEFADTPTHERHLVGSSPVLQCVVSGLPKPEVSWRFNRQRIDTDDGNDKYELVRRGLKVNRLEVWDNGTYECRAEVASHGNVKLRHVQLEVLYPPTITRAPTADRVVKGYNATLRCHANGKPAVQYEWFREQKMSEMIHVKVRLAQGSDTYVIHDVNADDEGRYFCRATNAFGVKEASVDVRMLVPPVIESGLQSEYVVKEGSTLRVLCEATGVPTPQIVWRRAGTDDNVTVDPLLAELAKSGALRVEEMSAGVSQLVINDVSRSHAGQLTCSAHNDAGSASNDFAVVVHFSPTLELIGRRQLGWSGESRNITCIGKALPVPSMNWYRGEQYLHDSDTYRITNVRSADRVASTLSIFISGEEQRWLFGIYSCIAKNIYGYVTDSATLVEAVVPEMPRNVSVINETETTVSLTASVARRRLDSSNTLSVSSWRIQYVHASTDGDTLTTVFNTSELMRVSSLTPGSTYAFSLSAGNAVGYGPAVKFRVTTLPLRQPAKHQHTEIDALELEGSLHDDDNVYHYRPARPKHSDNDDTVPKINHVSAGGHHLDVDYPSYSGSEGESGGQPFVERASLMMSLGVGAGVLLVVVILAAMCGVVWRTRRRRRKSVARAPPVVDSYALVPLSSRRPDVDPLPDVDAASPGLRRSPSSASATPRSLRHAVGRAPVPSASVQQLEWQRMLRTTECDDVINYEDDAGGGPPLPPPPAFLLRAGSGRRAPLVTDEIQDGYHSGDNVDDDIERIGYFGGSGAPPRPQLANRR